MGSGSATFVGGNGVPSGRVLGPANRPVDFFVRVILLHPRRVMATQPTSELVCVCVAFLCCL